VVFIESTLFTRRLGELAEPVSDKVLEQIEADLLDDPERGKLVPGLGGVRKARVANPARGKGKRGGFRYLYLYLKIKGHIHLLFLLDKNEQEDLAEDQRKALLAWAKELKGQG